MHHEAPFGVDRRLSTTRELYGCRSSRSGIPVLTQRLVIALLFEDGLDTSAELAVRESIAQRFLSQHPTNNGILLAL
ncbi:ATP-dependent RNA helicase suv3 [Fusarium oxysporum f. sp. albedinis]|nr:ATP-dependent RNA helicase suv3 [Fusarium oxysporum f. sp. albedinis]